MAENICSAQKYPNNCKYYGGFCNCPSVPWAVCGFRNRHHDCPWFEVTENGEQVRK